MREIKFRAWDKESNYMSYNFNPVQHGEYNFFLFCKTVHIFHPDVILMQFTGLKDKNGKEIYEEDIVRSEGNLLSIQYSIDGNHAYYAGYRLDDPGLETVMELFNYGELEVIGNIYENPELLEFGPPHDQVV